MRFHTSSPEGNRAEVERQTGNCSGLLIINADDWGRDPHTTDSILHCALRGAVSSASAMVFMEDSERAAAIAQESNIDAGLHLNFTTPFSAPHCPRLLVQHQSRLAHYLLRHPIARVVFHPGLVRSFEYVVAAQLEEFHRLYQRQPDRLDGHHHVHLCANVLLGGLLPPGTIIRKYFSAEPGKNSRRDGLYRTLISMILRRRHTVVDFFFSLPPIESPRRLQHIFTLSRQFVVEMETHPVNPEEYRFLTGGELFRRAPGIQIASRFALSGTRDKWRREFACRQNPLRSRAGFRDIDDQRNATH